jgi:hypothetical protein
MLFLLLGVWLAAAPADCPTEQSSGASLPMAIDLGRRYPGPGGQVFMDLPMTSRDACTDAPRPGSDVLRGEPGDLLNPRH